MVAVSVENDSVVAAAVAAAAAGSEGKEFDRVRPFLCCPFKFSVVFLFY